MNAVDGLVAIGNSSSVQILEKAKQYMQGNRKQSAQIEWIDEAIEQIHSNKLEESIKKL